MTRVLVYGTLRRGASNAHRMTGGRFVGEATVPGRLIRIDWYPGLVLDPAAGPVRGEVWEVSREVLGELDRFEGCDPATGRGDEYRRVEAEVELDGGGKLAAQVWDWIGPTAGFEVIGGGDWMG